MTCTAWIRSRPRPWILALLGLLAAVALPAEEGILSLLVTDISDRPIQGVVLSPGGDGAQSAPTDSSGRTRIRLAAATSLGSWVSLTTIPTKGKPEWVFISPWHQRVLVPPFANESENFVPIVLARRASRELLTSPVAITALMARILAQLSPRPQGEEISPEERQAILSEQSAAFGFHIKDVDKAIRARRSRAKTSYEAGLTALYEQNFPLAEQKLTDALASSEKNLQESSAKVAEVASFLGKAQYQQGQYQEAATSFRRAYEIWPQRPEILDALGICLLGSGDFRAAEAPLSAALAERERTLGTGNPDIIVSLSHMGLLSEALGRYDDAERFHLTSVRLIWL